MNHQGLPDRAPRRDESVPYGPLETHPAATEVAPQGGAPAPRNQQELSVEVIRACERRESYLLQLLVPVKFGSEEIRELTFRRPNAETLEGWNLGEKRYGAYLSLAARLCGVDPAVVKKLDIDDANRAVMVASFFSGVGLPTGGP